MKKVIGMLALIALVGNIANAELLKNFKYDGKIEVNAYNQNNADFNKDLNDKSGFVDTRVMLNAGFDLNEDVDAVVTAVKNNRQYGQASESASQETVAPASDGILGNVYFEQAYLNLKGVFGIDHKLGRQFYGEAGDMVVYYGPQMWPYTSPMAVNAIDGWTGWHKLTGLGRDWDLHAIIAKQAQGNGNTDINLSGINAKTAVYDVKLNGYVYQKNDNNTSAGNNDYLTLIGIRANYAIPQVKNLVVAAEYDMNMGRNTNADDKHNGIAYKLNADYSMDLAGKLAFAAEYAHQSGDDNATDSKDEAFRDINGDYRPGIIMGGGFAGAAFGANDGFTTYNVGAMWTPAKLEKLTLAAKYYNFSADNKNTFTADEHVGNEFDLCAKWQHSDNVAVKGYYAMFMPEKDNVATDDNQTMMGAAFMVKF